MNARHIRQFDRLLATAIVAALGVLGHGLHDLMGLEHGCAERCCERPFAPRESAGRAPAIRTCSEPVDPAPVVKASCELCELLASFRSEPPRVASVACTLLAAPVFPVAPSAGPFAKPSRRPPARGPPTLL